MLQADPSTLPPYRQGHDKGIWLSTGKGGGFFAYCRAVKPGLPPLGWRDITPYFGGAWPHVSDYDRRAKPAGYIVRKQVVRENGQLYRRIAVALNPVSSSNKRSRKDTKNV